MISIAFYNLENFFDTIDNQKTKDNDFTPKGIMHWIKKRYFNKAKRIGKTISKIGLKETGNSPVLIGLAEVENKRVLNDLINENYLKNKSYGFVHFDSADIRGMDVALLYDKERFELLETHHFPVELYNNRGEIYPSRDILYCKGNILNTTIHLFVNHWPSRREGDLETNQKRKLAALRLREQIDYIKYEENNPKIIVMGDFNTNPNDEIIERYLQYNDFVNPAKQKFLEKKGTTHYHKQWLMFDQILFSKNFIYDKIFHSFHIYKPKFLIIWKGKYKGFPFRTFRGKKYQNGYSDHFPVYSILKFQKKR